MKVYHFKHQEILLNEAVINDEQLVELYKDLLLKLLVRHQVSSKKIFEVINLNNYTISSKPFIVEFMLKKEVLPSFVFFTCSN